MRNPILYRPDAIPRSATELKLHLLSGELIVLRPWWQSDTAIGGTGRRYGINRAALGEGEFSVHRDSIALIETTSHSLSRAAPSIVAMSLFTVASVGYAIHCANDPKSCFGSCPTFYVDGGSDSIPAAEGFSGSIARALETRDVDALPAVRSTNGRFTVRMTNEALESHSVQSLRVLAVPRPPGGRVFRGVDDRYYPASRPVLSPTRCAAAEGGCAASVASLDQLERRSAADSTDLAARETIELEFPAPPLPGRLGLIIGARQALVSTFLFYQTIAYLGRGAGEWLAQLERAGPERARAAMGMAKLLGGIDAEVADAKGEWHPIGTHDEPGPIATDVEVLPFQVALSGPVRVRLRMAKGAWRLNWVGLATLDEHRQPAALEPVLVKHGTTRDTAALARLRDRDRYLVTYPGDHYAVTYELPAGLNDAELFLESRGFYYEWTREQWLAEENPAMSALTLTRPGEALRRLAPDFKRVEPRMDDAFWASRFGR